MATEVIYLHDLINDSKYLNHLPLRKKMSLIIFITIILLSGVFIGTFQNLIQQYDQSLYRTNAQLLDIVITNIESEMASIEDLSNYITTDLTVQENLIFLIDNPNSNKQTLARRNAYEALYAYMYANDYIKSVTLAFDTDSITIGSSFPETEINMPKVDTLTTEANGGIVWISGVFASERIFATRQIRQIKFLRLRKLSVLYLEIDMDKLISDTLTAAGYIPNSLDFILFSENRQIYPTTQTNYFDYLNKDIDNTSYIIDTIDGDKKFIITGTMRTVPWDYYYFRDYNRIFQQLIHANFYTILLTVIFSCLAFLFSNIVLKSIFKHFNYLLIKIKQFGDGVLTPSVNAYDYEKRSDEIGILHHSFDEMTKSVKVLRDENYDKKLLLKDATIKMLEQQISPHFLYNTLDTINCIAQMQGADDISKMVLSLGNLFRASISNEKEVIYLEEEIGFLNSYIQIQKIRFNDRLNVTINIDPKYHSIHIPKLCLQPLVENALKYAMEYNTDVCYVDLNVSENDDVYMIQVSNTGSYFEDNLLDKIQSEQIIPQGTGVGLGNIDSRLKLIYGDDMGLKFMNADNRAIVCIKIPKNFIG